LGEKAKEYEESREREKEELIGRLQTELSGLQGLAGDREAERKQLLQEMERSYRAHQEELDVVKQSYLQVEEEYKQWIDGCNAEKLELIRDYELKLTEAKAQAQSAPSSKSQTAFEDELSRRERESMRLIALTAKQASDIKSLRCDLESAEKDKSELILKVSALENALLDKTEVLSSLDQAYSKLVQQNKQEEERAREMREKYHSVNREFVELRSKCSVLFESLEEGRRGSQGEGAELVRLRKDLLQCRELLERSKNNEMALGVKLADATRTVKDRLAKLESEREESLTELLAERLQNARLQEELQETRQHLKREYDLSVENTRKELERQISANTSRARPGSDPEK
jgi:chromosome segregation ATPase